MGEKIPDVLPNSIPRHTRSVQGRHYFVGSIRWIEIFCANACGKSGGFVPEDGPRFAFYLCPKCAEKWAPLAGTMITPDEFYWRTLHAEQMEKYGRLLTPDEIVEEVAKNSTLAKLARDRKG